MADQLRPFWRTIAPAAGLVCLAVAVVSMAGFFSRPLVARLGLIPSPGPRVGAVIRLPRATFSAERTVLVFGRQSCGACRAAAPEVGRLAARVNARAGWRLVVVTDDRGPDWARLIGLESDDVVQADLRALGLSAVPAIVVTDRDGRVILTRLGIDDSVHHLIAQAAGQ